MYDSELGRCEESNMLDLKDGTTLSVDSIYDSGLHKGFVVETHVKGEYCGGKRLDELLTKEQIRTLEMTLLVLTQRMIEGEA